MCSEQHPRLGEPGTITARLDAVASPLALRGSALPAILIILSVSVTAFGQRGVSTVRGGVSLAKHVPASVNLFITVRQLDEVDAAMHRAHAWRLLPILAGNPMESNTTFDLRGALTDFIGPGNSIRIDDLMHTEIGIVAPSWRRLGRAVWLVRLADESVIDKWFPESHHKGGGDSRATRFFKTADDVLVCVRDNIAVIARRKGSGSLLHETMLLMAGRRDAVLEQAPEYQELIAYLPHGPLAVVYIKTDEKAGSGGHSPFPLWPAIDRAVTGLYEGDGRIDFAIRASLKSPESRQVLSAEAIERLVRLPQTTLFATALTMDFDRAYEAATADRFPAVWGRLLTLLAGLRSPAATPSEVVPQLGPYVIITWDQDLRDEGSSPQVAMMIQCTNARRLRDEASTIARNALKVIQAVDTVGADALPTINEAEHLGTPIVYVPLRTYSEKSRFPSMRLLGATEPAWAALGNDWFIFALSRDHIERVLDAWHGLIPTLATLDDMQSLQQRRAKRTALSIVQGDLAADVLDRWLKKYEAGSPSLLDATWWTAGSRPARRKRQQLGIGMKADQQPGAVVVARVYPQTAADKRLQPGDRIIGIDGRLLDLTSPNADLRKGWVKSKADPGPRLRVQRGDTFIDVVLPRDDAAVQTLSPQVKPADAVRELASLGRTLQFASFASYASKETRYSARLSLRFAPTTAP